MPKDPFLLVSLNEEKARKLSQVLSNPTATKILNHLTKKDATETELSKKLNIPLSTVHYNLKQLTEAKLVVVEEFHYSSRGKEVNHYKLANKYIIIAPSEDDSFLKHLKKYLPVTTIAAGAAVLLKALQFTTSGAARTAPQATEAFAGVQALDAAKTTNCIVEGGCVVTREPWWQSPMVDWLLIGAFSVIVIFVLIEFVRWKFRK